MLDKIKISITIFLVGIFFLGGCTSTEALIKNCKTRMSLLEIKYENRKKDMRYMYKKSEYHKELANLYFKIGNNMEARKHYNKHKSLNPFRNNNDRTYTHRSPTVVDDLFEGMTSIVEIGKSVWRAERAMKFFY